MLQVCSIRFIHLFASQYRQFIEFLTKKKSTQRTRGKNRVRWQTVHSSTVIKMVFVQKHLFAGLDCAIIAIHIVQAHTHTPYPSYVVWAYKTDQWIRRAIRSTGNYVDKIDDRTNRLESESTINEKQMQIFFYFSVRFFFSFASLQKNSHIDSPLNRNIHSIRR